jgi:ribosomal protein L29
MITNEQIKKLSTKRLYTILKYLRRSVFSYRYDEYSYGEEPENPSKEEILYDRLKNELNTREHIVRKPVVRNERKSIKELSVKQLKELFNSRYKRNRYFKSSFYDTKLIVFNELKKRWFPEKDKFIEECQYKMKYGDYC